jgi:hypothetical protein
MDWILKYYLDMLELQTVKDEMVVQVALMIAFNDVACSDFQKYSEQLYECLQKCVPAKGLCKGFLVILDLRYGSIPDIFKLPHIYSSL